MLSEKLDRIANLDVIKVLVDTLKSHEGDIILLNQNQLNKDGTVDINNPGQKLQYSEKYIPRKQKFATFKNTDFIDLHAMGIFQENMKLIFFENYFVIQDTDLKWANFLEPQERFTNALGLTEESKSELRDLVRDDFIKAFKEIL